MNRITRHGIALVGIVALAACSPGEILETENPDIIDPGSVATPAGLAALHAGALGDFSFAVVGDNGGSEGQILVSGSFSDELGNSETFPTRKEFDQRGPINLQNGTLTGVFRNLHRARRSAERAAETIKDVLTTTGGTPATDSRISEAYLLAGYTYLFFGENYCSGVPISEAAADGSLTFGPPLTTTQLFDEAIKRFDSLVVYPGTNNTIRRAALVGKARALLNLDQAAAAGALVDSLPANWAYVTTHTVALGRQQNGIFVFINQNERWSVANLDGGNGLDFRGASDPRVPWHRFGTDVGFDAATPQYDQGKYASETASVVISGGVEARLIAAEAALQAGDNPTWLGILNALRADPTLVPSTFPAGFPPAFPALGALADPGNAAAREDLMFRERAFWLYLTGHRLGDLRRMVRQYGRIGTTAGGVFPGAGGAPYVIDGNPKGGIFGNEMNLPVPFDETNNPQFLTCIDRNP